MNSKQELKIKSKQKLFNTQHFLNCAMFIAFTPCEKDETFLLLNNQNNIIRSQGIFIDFL